VKQRSAELVLELLDCAGEGGLADVALFRGAREIELPREGDEVADLLHFHGRVPRERLRPLLLHPRNNARQQMDDAKCASK
jgi:hypothetical protein